MTSHRGQALIVALGAMFVVMLGAGALAALGGALAQKGRLQRATDLAALSAARAMHDDFARLFEPPFIDGRANLRHLSRAAYLSRARAAALEGVINLKTAKALGLEVPDRLLIAADEVIE